MIERQLLPPLSSGEYEDLKADIAARGVQVPILVSTSGVVLDGHHRKQIADELSLDCPVEAVDLGGDQRREDAYALRVNLNRRNLSLEQRKEVTKAQQELARLWNKDGWTQQQIADELGVAQRTVSDWLNISDSGTAKAYRHRDARTKVEPDDIAVIIERVAAGETQTQVAADFSISQPRVAQILQESTTRPHVSHNSGENEWYTPPAILDAAREVLGTIDLDPASSATANTLVQATEFYSEQDNGLRRPWAGKVWMNPPYSKEMIWPFCEKLCEEIADDNVTEALVLVNNATETAWFQRMAELASAICFPAKRVKFLKPDLTPTESGPLQGQAILYFGENVEEFRARFVDFGFTVTL